jgi:hypothetical protein
MVRAARRFRIPAAAAIALSFSFSAAPAATLAAPTHASTLPSLSTMRLSSRQTAEFSHGPARRVIIMLRTGMKGTHASTRTWDSAVAAQQLPLIHELKSVRASHVNQFHVVDAVSARVTKSEVRYLNASENVKHVFPDVKITLPKINYELHQLKSQMQHMRPSTLTNLPDCNASKPLLEPQALQLTNTAFADQSTPSAQNIVTGQGVTVAYIADGLNIFDPDFYRHTNDGSRGPSVFADYQDFGGDGVNAPTDGEEAFGDASSIAAQGNKTYNLNTFVEKKLRAENACPMRIRGMAPGASLMGLDVFGASFTYESTVMQAVEYAVDHSANIISESLGFYLFPDNNRDPLTLADNAAVKSGVTVVVSSGDSGTANTVASPGSDPHVITAGATTQFQAYEQTEYGGAPLATNGALDNNISAFSSAGSTQNGEKAVDVVAPGDLGWALCTASIEYDCYSFANRLSNFQLFGGTSESAPLTAGEAALVIQAYRNSHAGASPSPKIVKQLITSTATDLGIPSSEQGAGLINSLRAVQAAEWNGAPNSGTGSSLSIGPSTLTANTLSNTALSFPFTVRNTGATSQVVTPKPTTQSSPMSSKSYNLTLKPKKDPHFKGAFGKWAYIEQPFTVPSGATRLEASIAYSPDAFTPPFLTLISPSGQLAAYSIPQGVSGYEHVDVRFPATGTWKAAIWTYPERFFGYTGNFVLNVTSSSETPWGTVTPASKTLGPGEAGHFTLHLTSPAGAGDQTGQLTFGAPQSADSGSQAGALPIVVRTSVPISGGTGTFGGVLYSGNGRDTGQTLAWDVQIPAGLNDLDVNVKMPKNDFGIEGYLMDPNGLCKSAQINIVSYKKPGSKRSHQYITNTMQFYAEAPHAGNWRLVVVAYYNLAGKEVSAPLTGTVTFNGEQVTSANVPDSSGTTIASGQSTTATVTVKNTGNAVERYFLDPRLSTTAKVHPKWMVDGYGEISPTPSKVHLPDDAYRGFVVPPQTTRVTAWSRARYPNVPIQNELLQTGGGEYSPDVAGNPKTGPDGDNQSWASVNHYEIPTGFWWAMDETIGPYFDPSPWVTVKQTISLTMRQFDPSVSATTGDLWQEYFDNQRFGKQLVLMPGQSGTITVTFSPAAGVSGAQSGDLYLDTFSDDMGTGDEVAAIPYSYTAG